MSEFHYVRTLGEDGGVDACNGPAIGVDIETVLQDGLPPWNIALEIIAGLCEILDIAEEDNEVHGDISPKYVFIDETGAVSLEGFGMDRRRTAAPEGSPRGPRTDLYGLGLTAMRLVCTYPLPQLPDDDAYEHDDLIIDSVLQVDLEGVTESMQGDIQWYLAKLLSFDREDRPSALEAWRSFIAFAREVEGPEIVEWCAAALDGGGRRRDEIVGRHTGQIQDDVAIAPVNNPVDDEDLVGVVAHTGPLDTALEFGSTANSKGNKTAFWTKDAMRKAFSVEDEDRPPMGAGGGGATNFWSKDELQAMEKGEAEAPRPKRADGVGEKRRQSGMHRLPSSGEYKAPNRRLDAPSLEPQGPSTGWEPPHEPEPQIRPILSSNGLIDATQILGEPLSDNVFLPEPETGPSHPSVAGQIPVALPPAAPQPPPPQAPPSAPPSMVPVEAQQQPRPIPVVPLPAEDEGGGGVGLYVFGGGAFVMLVSVGIIGLFVVLGAIFYLSQPGEVVTTVPAVPVPALDLGNNDAKEPGSEDKTPAKSKPKKKKSEAKKPKERDKKRKDKKPPPAKKPELPPVETPPPPPASNGPASVRLTSGGRGSVTCQGKRFDFDGGINFTLQAFELPAVCLVTMGGVRSVFKVNGSGSIRCDQAGGHVTCNRKSVP